MYYRGILAQIQIKNTNTLIYISLSFELTELARKGCPFSALFLPVYLTL